VKVGHGKIGRLRHLRNELRYQRSIGRGGRIAVTELVGHGSFRYRRRGANVGISETGRRIVAAGAGLVAVARQVFVEEQFFTDRAHADAGSVGVIIAAAAPAAATAVCE